MSEYILGSSVEDDLDIIWEYISQDDIHAADRLIAKLFDAFQALAEAPRTGHSRKDLTNLPILFWPVGSYLILYMIEGKQVQIIAVTHGARDVPKFLQRRANDPLQEKPE